jgi:hypothetical protein
MTTLQLLSHGAVVLPTWRRSVRMVQRNLLVYKHTWMVIFTGFFEPLFYLLSIGLGLGAFVPDIGGVSYTAFVAPGLLASSCMNGAISTGSSTSSSSCTFRRPTTAFSRRRCGCPTWPSAKCCGR